MSNTYRITEPHPSVPASHYIYSGRGGAGNITRVNPKDITKGADATGPASRIKLPRNRTNLFTSGRGGAGNVHSEKERAIFSFDEELAQQRRIMENSAPVYHYGRGGAGNYVDEMQPKASRTNSASSTASSDSNSTRGRGSIDGAWARITRSLSRHQ